MSDAVANGHLVCELQGITKAYGPGQIDVLKGVDLRLARGEFVAIVGQSGSGKTTLLNILGLLDRPSGGRQWIDGQEVSQMRNGQRAVVRQQKIGFVFQAFHLLPYMSALDNVALPLVYRGSDWQAARHRAARSLQDVGLAGHAGKYPGQLSAGQQQRVAVARCTVSSPALLLADEPTGNLDRSLALTAFDLLDGIRRDNTTSIVLITHDEALAQRCDRVCRLLEGAWTSS